MNQNLGPVDGRVLGLTVEWMESERSEQEARAEALRRHQAESERSQARLDVLYEARLDEIREQQLRIQQSMRTTEAIALPLTGRRLL